MGHHITAFIIQGNIDPEVEMQYDLQPVTLSQGLTLFHIDHYYTAYWQHMLNVEGMLECSQVGGIFPSELVIYEMAAQLTQTRDPDFAIIQTDYFGGIGRQYASVYHGRDNADKRISTINQALRYLGVMAIAPADEFDTVGLGDIRTQPEHLDKYVDLAEELGL